MSKSCLIIHDSYSSPAEPWIVELAAQLRARGYAVYTPAFPTPIGQDVVRWAGILEPYRAYINAESVLVGVGVGASVVLRILTAVGVPVAQTILLAPFTDRLPNDNDNLLIASFIAEPFDWSVIQKNAGTVSVLVSSDDSVVPVALSQSVAQLIGGNIQVLPGRGHFRQSNGVMALLELPSIIDVGGLRTTTVFPTLDSATAAVAPNSEQSRTPSGSSETAPSVLPPVYEPPTHARTLRSDFSSALSGASTREMAHILGEYRAEHERVVVGKYARIRKAVFMSISILCIIGGLGAIGWIVKTKMAEPVIVPVQELPLRAGSIADVDFAPTDTVTDIQKRMSESLVGVVPAEQALHVIRFRQTDTTSPSAQTFFKAIEPDISTTFTKTIQSPFVVGYVYIQSEWKPFALFAVDNFARASKSITEWDELLSVSVMKLLAPQYSFALSNNLYTTEFQSRTKSNRDVQLFVLTPKDQKQEQIKPLANASVDAPVNSATISTPSSSMSDQLTPIATEAVATKSATNRVLFLTPTELKSLVISETTIIATTLPERLAATITGDVIVIPATPGHLAVDDMRSITNITTESDKTVFSTVAANPLSVFALLYGEGDSALTQDTPSDSVITGPVDVFGYTFINDSYLLFVSDVNIIPVLTDRLLQKL